MALIKIFKEPIFVDKYIKDVVQSADNNRKSFGFLPKRIYRESALQGHLWVAVDSETGEFAGHLLFGGTFPNLRIFQVFSDSRKRRKGVASLLVDELETYAEQNSYLSITARVASDLRIANDFWASKGFIIARHFKGGRSRGRHIYLRVRQIESSSLFSVQKSRAKLRGSIKGPDHTKTRAPIFAIDLNVILDVVRNRPRHNEAHRVIQAGFSHKLQLVTTPELEKELKRYEQEREEDPLLEFVSGLPKLPEIESTVLEPILNEIGEIVFPHRYSEGTLSHNDLSDIKHLAHSIHHQFTGFITSDEAILGASDKLLERFGISIVGLGAVLASSNEDDVRPIRKWTKVHGTELKVECFNESDRRNVQDFFGTFRFPSNIPKTALAPGHSGAKRSRLCLFQGKNLIGFASWDEPAPFEKEVELYFFLNENGVGREALIDCILDYSVRQLIRLGGRTINLITSAYQSTTIETAISRGFSEYQIKGQPELRYLRKVSIGELITINDWPGFCSTFSDLTGWKLPKKAPSYEMVRYEGLPLELADGNVVDISIFELEKLASPVLFLFSDRSGVIVPIRKAYSAELFGDSLGQLRLQLVPSLEASMLNERAFFNHKKSKRLFDDGSIVLFYESKRSGGCGGIFAVARVTCTEVASVENAKLKFMRSGVLTESEIESRSSASNQSHVFTFDNIHLFERVVALNEMKKMGISSSTSFVSPERISGKKIVDVCSKGLGNA